MITGVIEGGCPGKSNPAIGFFFDKLDVGARWAFQCLEPDDIEFTRAELRCSDQYIER